MTSRKPAPRGKRCGCRDENGKQLGTACPKLVQRHHGTYEAERRIDTSEGRRKLHRSGFASAADRDAFLDYVRDLVRLADDDGTRARIGDLIWASTRRRGPLPPIEDVRRRLGLGLDPASPGVTFGEAWTAWLAGKRKLRPSARARLEQIGEHWLVPVLTDVPVERLNGAHVAGVFARIEKINAQIAVQRGDGRAFVHVDGDVRTRPRPLGTASQHRVYAALREFCNFEVRKTRRLAFNPGTVELEPEIMPEAQRWTAAETRQFLAYCDGKPLGLMFRTVALRGARRGEAIGFRWSTSDLDKRYLGVARTVLLIGAQVVEGTPKSKAGERRVWLDEATVQRYREHRSTQVRARMRASTAWQDHDLIFCRDDGTPWPPDQVSREWKRYCGAAGVHVIKMHEGRHSAASLARDAGVEAKVRREQMGHTTDAMTDHYTHVMAAAHLEAAEKVARLVDQAGA